MKLTKRKGFNFLRSYFDVLNDIPEDKDKLDFLISIINKQFLDEDPKDLNFITNLCYNSQRHSIEKSVKGWQTANKTDMQGNPLGSIEGDPKGGTGSDPKEEEVQEKEKEQQQEEEEKIDVDVYDSFKNQIGTNGSASWRETFYMRFKLKDKTLSKIVDEFIIHHKLTKEQPPKNLQEFKTHLNYWCGRIEPEGRLDKYLRNKPKQTGAL